MPAKRTDATTPPADPWVNPVMHRVGVWLSAHRKFLLALTALGGLAAVMSPWAWIGIPNGAEVWWLMSNDQWLITFRVLTIGVGSFAVLAVIADKMADAYDAHIASLTIQEGEKAAEKAIDDLNVVLGEAIHTMFLTGKTREEAVESLRRTVVLQSARSVGAGSRATSYNLHREPSGLRVLKDAAHGAEQGRKDKSNTPFYERLHPQLEIWRMLDREDDEPDVRTEPEVIEGLDWSKKEYCTFFSVPVKAVGVQLGMLSVNNSKEGSIGGPQRAVTVAMARTLALAIAAMKGPKEMKELAALQGMSEPGDTVTAVGEGGNS